MSADGCHIVRCPPDLYVEAMALVLSELAPSQRRQTLPDGCGDGHSVGQEDDGLYVALQDGRLCGAAWGQHLPGKAALFWPPQLLPDQAQDTALRLVRAVLGTLDAAGVEIAQVLQPARDAESAIILESVGFSYSTDLLYLACEAEQFPRQPWEEGGLEFQPYHESQRCRLAELIERTYDGTRDCPSLNGVREIDDVIDGYQAIGRSGAKHWFLARASDQDAGVLLLADHPEDRWELVYMGVVPEVRGNGWGRALIHHAQWLARCADVERIVLAADAVNEPALAIYRSAGFLVWDRRSILVRLRRKAGV